RKDFLYFSNKTPGEKIFTKFGIAGARGEALTGYYKIFFQGLLMAPSMILPVGMLTYNTE
ncbi:MAG: hypothetical protein Q8830_03755, partial [Candidatus Phytoplasma australasiaticum]|nr:hypothetical protein [Candidatus Phytoplasma australasiaticum]